MKMPPPGVFRVGDAVSVHCETRNADDSLLLITGEGYVTDVRDVTNMNGALIRCYKFERFEMGRSVAPPLWFTGYHLSPREPS